MKPKTILLTLLALLLLAAVPLAGAAWLRQWLGTGRAPYVTVEVVRGPFEVVVQAKGKLKAAKSIGVPCPISWKPIIWLIPEGTMVKKGDPIVKFDKREIEESLRQGRANYRIAVARLKEAQQRLKATEESLRAKVVTLGADLRIAELEVQDLENRPRPDDLKRAEIELKRAKAVIDAAKAEFEAMQAVSQDKTGKAVFTPSDVRAVKLTYDKALAEYKASVVNYRATKAGTHPDTIEEAKLKAKRAQLDLSEVQKELPDTIKQFKAGIEKAKATVDKAENDIKRQEEDLARCDFKSPADGMVAYRSLFGKRLGKGVTMWKGAMMMDLPDLSRMHLKTRVRESDIAQVAVGQHARVRVDAVPDKIFAGKVLEIGKVAKDSSETETVGFAQERKDTGIRVFDVIIAVEQSDPVLKPNMMGRADIIVWTSDSALSLPRDAVLEDQGERVVFVPRAGRVERVPVQVGRANADRVVIESGLEAGQQVCLKPEETGEAAP